MDQESAALEARLLALESLVAELYALLALTKPDPIATIEEAIQDVEKSFTSPLSMDIADPALIAYANAELLKAHERILQVALLEVRERIAKREGGA